MTEILDYLDDIRDAVEKGERFIEGMEYEEFAEDANTIDAVLRNLEVIGEATNGIPDDIRHEYDTVPRSEMAGMRDKLIHGYATIDLQIIWTTIQEEIPALASQIESVRNEFE
jgi:uncharacterized protein with HEPN domain